MRHSGIMEKKGSRLLQAEGSSPRAKWLDVSFADLGRVFTKPEASKRHMAAVQANETRRRPGGTTR
jgi:hypothetical protein